MILLMLYLLMSVHVFTVTILLVDWCPGILMVFPGIMDLFCITLLTINVLCVCSRRQIIVLLLLMIIFKDYCIVLYWAIVFIYTVLLYCVHCTALLNCSIGYNDECLPKLGNPVVVSWMLSLWRYVHVILCIISCL